MSFAFVNIKTFYYVGVIEHFDNLYFVLQELHRGSSGSGERYYFDRKRLVFRAYVSGTVDSVSFVHFAGVTSSNLFVLVVIVTSYFSYLTWLVIGQTNRALYLL